MSEDPESVDNVDDYECVNGIFILRSSDDQEEKSEKKGTFSNKCPIFPIQTE